MHCNLQPRTCHTSIGPLLDNCKIRSARVQISRYVVKSKQKLAKEEKTHNTGGIPKNMCQVYSNSLPAALLSTSVSTNHSLSLTHHSLVLLLTASLLTKNWAQHGAAIFPGTPFPSSLKNSLNKLEMATSLGAPFKSCNGTTSPVISMTFSQPGRHRGLTYPESMTVSRFTCLSSYAEENI